MVSTGEILVQVVNFSPSSECWTEERSEAEPSPNLRDLARKGVSSGDETRPMVRHFPPVGRDRARQSVLHELRRTGSCAAKGAPPVVPGPKSLRPGLESRAASSFEWGPFNEPSAIVQLRSRFPATLRPPAGWAAGLVTSFAPGFRFHKRVEPLDRLCNPGSYCRNSPGRDRQSAGASPTTFSVPGPSDVFSTLPAGPGRAARLRWF
jgi:hypothetical protein